MPIPFRSGNQIRQDFIDYFVEQSHTLVPSSSLVPGGDATLLFTNAGMVQFKEIFLSTDKLPYKRAVNSQKCMRVAGKHNDLEDVGQDDTHHTFFEMLGNWSFGDYYKKEAITWAWQLLTDAWGLPKDKLYATCFQDDKGNIPADEEAAEIWRQQPGIEKSHVLFFGRKDNLWEMAETGPCGPCSEIHLDRGEEFCNLKGKPHKCTVNGDCERYLELWNLVFIQYNRIDEETFERLPATHVDTGMGFERIVAVLQGVDSNYRTDLLWPLILKIQELNGQSNAEREENFTPYRVIADHARAAAFLIADGVVPGNMGRNYVCRMIIRRAYRFGGKIGLDEPFLARIAEIVIDNYEGFYPELGKNRTAIIKAISREEEQFQRTIERATGYLNNLLDQLETNDKKILSGEQAADLYTTLGMPFEITRDIARERGLEVDEAGFKKSMEEHRLASGGGKAMGEMDNKDADTYRQLCEKLTSQGKLGIEGVIYDPYQEPHNLSFESEILAIVSNDAPVESATAGNKIEVLLPETCFYVEAGGQVSDTGKITSNSASNNWQIRVDSMRKPAAGIFVHVGEVISGEPSVGDKAIATVDTRRRKDIMRNHTATHLLHSALHHVLGPHARQAGSLVDAERLRFDFTHPEALTYRQIEAIEQYVNEKILDNYTLNIQQLALQEALDNGAIALFGEKYSEEVRNICMGEDEIFSNELCGGTHVDDTNDIGIFLIVSEGSVAAGVRRIEAITGRMAFQIQQEHRRILHQVAEQLDTTPEQIVERTESFLNTLNDMQKQIATMRKNMATLQFTNILDKITKVRDVSVLTAKLHDADANTMRQLADQFRNQNPTTSIAVLATVQDERPIIITAVTEDLVGCGIKAGDLAGFVARQLGGGGGGKPTLAQAGGKDASKLDEALSSVAIWVEDNLG